MSFGVTQVIRRAGLVKQRPARSESRRQNRELLAQQTPDNDDQIKRCFRGRPRQRFFGGFASKLQHKPSLFGALAGNGQSFVGEVGESSIPAMPGEPQGMPSRAPGQIQSASRCQASTDLYNKRSRSLAVLRVILFAWHQAVRRVRHSLRYTRSMAGQKTFYLETFGCQMNVHDSEKVIGTLEQQGYTQVETEEAADLILYNTCSIRDKAEQKVFHRLNDYKALYKQGKRFGVLGCVAQQEGERIFERAPYVSLVSGSASYRRLPEMLVQIEQGATRVTGLDDRQTDETFETEFTARSNPHRGYITIIEGCDKFCAYCVVPYTRGKERSRKSDSVLAEARHIDSTAGAERELIPRPGR